MEGSDSNAPLSEMHSGGTICHTHSRAGQTVTHPLRQHGASC